MRSCAKTACPRPATVSCGLNYARRVVWLLPLRRDPDPSYYDLCEDHARTLRPPRGWELEDLRAGQGPVPAP